jgi:hypothetical protein
MVGVGKTDVVKRLKKQIWKAKEAQMFGNRHNCPVKFARTPKECHPKTLCDR